MKLISEHVDNIEYMVEADDSGKKNYRIRGVFMQSEICLLYTSDAADE